MIEIEISNSIVEVPICNLEDIPILFDFFSSIPLHSNHLPLHCDNKQKTKELIISKGK